MNEITVRKILETKYLKDNSIVVAGAKGLGRHVKWLHILGSSDIMEGCLDEGTLIMTTGVDFVDKEVAIRYITQLVNERTAGLMIETVMYYHEIDQELIDIANANDFPLIRIPKLLRFLDCSQGINTMIFQQEEQRKKDLSVMNYAWIEDWLDGSLKVPQIKEKLSDVALAGYYSGFAVCGIQLSRSISSGNEAENLDALSSVSSLSLSLEIKKFFEEAGLTVLTHVEGQTLVYIFFEKSPSENLLEKISSAINLLKKIQNSFINYANSKYAVGKKVSDLADVSFSMKTAMQLLDKANFEDGRHIVYDNLYVRRLFLDISDDEILQRYISDMLGELTLPENTALLETLQVYYKCNCSKQKAAEELYVSRQTLYARLAKIQSIVGDDFDLDEKRLAIECAIAALHRV